MLMRPIALLLFLAAAAPAQLPERTVTEGQAIDWSMRENGGPVRYRVGEVRLTLDAGADPSDAELTSAILTVEAPGFAALTVRGTPVGGWDGVRLNVGRLGGGRPFVLFQTYTGGAHCCANVQMILPDGDRLRAVEVGTWDGEFVDMPADLDGDGNPDFVVRDNRFLYAFASYAGSVAPPQVWNVIDGRAVDVSADPRFRRLFNAALAAHRARCLEGGSEANAPCAAFVADAARIGRAAFEQAWREMLPHYERAPAFGFPQGCRVATRESPCPENQLVDYPDFPTALRPFLEQAGYLPVR
jgi:hypothetical protein